MNRFALATVVFASLGSPALAQVPITGAYPPWIAGPTTYGPITIGPVSTPPTIAMTQPPPPYIVKIPAGDPLYGLLKEQGYVVGLNGYLPYDTGEYNLSGFYGNARYFGLFCITLPPPACIDPANFNGRYKDCLGQPGKMSGPAGTPAFFRP